MKYNRKSIAVITSPINPVVSTANMKTYLRVDTSDDDSLIAGLVSSTTNVMKQYLRRSLISETLELTMDGFWKSGSEDGLIKLGEGVHIGHYGSITGYGNEFDLPFRPIQSITSIKYYDTANTENTLSSAYYSLDETGGRVYLNEGYSFPTNLRKREAVKVRYVAGYGDDDTDIPAPIVQAIKMHVANLYDCREACGSLPDMCKSMVAGYKLFDGMGY